MQSLVALTVLSLSSAALSQTAAAERRTVIDMDADVVEGSLATPDVDVKKAPNGHAFRSLIRVRTEFRREILASAAHAAGRGM